MAARPRVRPGVLGWLLLVAAVGFCIAALAASWQDVRASIDQLSVLDLLGSGLAAAAGVLLTGLSWRAVLVGMGQHLPVHPALTLFTAAQLGKYVPGSVWVVAIQADLGRRHRIPASVMAISYLVAALIAVGTGAVMGLAGLLSPELPVARPLLVAVALAGIVLLVALARPAVLEGILAWLARLLRRDLPRVSVTPRAVALAVLLECLGWIMLGTHLWLLARPLGAAGATLPVTIGVFALAFVAGLVLIPLPAGLGVREGLLVAALAPSLGAGVAVTAAVLSRLVLVVVDLALAAGTGALGLARRSVRLSRRAEGSTSDRGSPPPPS